MMKSLILAALGGAGVLALASPALAECDSKQEDMVGKAIAEAARDYVPADRNANRYVDLTTCDGGSTKFDARFRYSVERDGQVAWVEGEARGKDDRVNILTVNGSSRDLQARDHASTDDRRN